MSLSDKKKIYISAAIFVASSLLCVVLLEIGLRAASGLYFRKTGALADPSSGKEAPVTVACFGDSHTFYPAIDGIGASSDYPAQLQKMFDAAHENVLVCNEGVPGFNSSQAYQRLTRVAAERRIDYAVLLVGSANGYNLAGYGDGRERSGPAARFFNDLRVVKLLRISRHNLRRVFGGKGDASAPLSQAMSPDGDPVVNGFKVHDADTRTEAELRHGLAPFPTGYVDLTRYYVNRGRYAEAIRVVERALEHRGADENTYALFGRCYAGMGEHAKAEAMFRQAIRLFPRRGYIEAGNYYEARGDHASAERMLARGAEYNPADGYVALGKFYKRRNDLRSAEKMFTKALSSSPFDAQYQLITLYARAGRFAEAEEAYKQAVIKFPERKSIAYALDWEYWMQKRYADAIRCHLWALEHQKFPERRIFYMLITFFQVQSEYSARDILTVIERVKKNNPSLAADPEFAQYAAYFENTAAWETGTRRWLGEDLDAIARYCDLYGITLIVQNYPAPQQANAELRAVAERYSLPFIDNCAQIAQLAAARGRKRYLRGDDHCQPEGHRVMAENVFNAIEALRRRQQQYPQGEPQ